MFSFFRKAIHEPVIQQRSDLLREPIGELALTGEDCDALSGASGAFGQGKSPIPVNGLLGTYKYLAKLHTTSSGAVVYFHRIGSLSIESAARPLDVYELVSLDGQQWDFLFFDMYHPRRSNLAPDGYALKPFDKEIGDLPFAFGVDIFCPQFPYDLPGAIEARNGLPAFARRVRERVTKGGFDRTAKQASRLANIRSRVSSFQAYEG